MADNARKYREKYGEWALVTGASAGIGLEFARALAREGMSIVLTARREDRLNALAAELKEKYHVDTRVVAVDLAANDGADRLADAVADLPIAFLVNNAGFGYAGRFDKLATDRLRSMVVVNCVVPVVLTSRIMPAMVQRGRGAISNRRLGGGTTAAAVARRLQRDQGLRSAVRRRLVGRAARDGYRCARDRAGTHGD